VSEKLPNGVRFGDLAIELGLSNAELVTKSFKVGIKVITSDVANYQLSQFEAEHFRGDTIRALNAWLDRDFCVEK